MTFLHNHCNHLSLCLQLIVVATRRRRSPLPSRQSQLCTGYVINCYSLLNIWRLAEYLALMTSKRYCILLLLPGIPEQADEEPVQHSPPLCPLYHS